MKKYLEEYSKYFNLHGDYMGLKVEKNCEGEILYRIKQMELQMWQKKEDLVKWLRTCAKEIEGMDE